MDERQRDTPQPVRAGTPVVRKRRVKRPVKRTSIAKPRGHVFHGTVRAPDQQATTKPTPIPRAKAMARALAKEYRDTFSVFMGVELLCYYEPTDAGVKFRRPARGEASDG